MAGHSKWANIKHRKGAQDAKRSKLFSKASKELTIAVKEGGADPTMNARLRLAIANAKGVNMPKDTIQKAINKGTDSDAANYADIMFEGYAPNGIAVIVECSTDNNNRTVSNIRSYFTKFNGSLGKSGSVEYMFDQKGLFTFEEPEGSDPDEMMLELIDGGAEEVEVEEGLYSVTTAKEDFGNMQNKLEELEIETENAGLKWMPQNSLRLQLDQAKTVLKLIDKIEDDDDVKEVYHNMEITDEIATEL